MNQQEIDELAIDMANARAQIAEDEELYVQEINKLKTTIKDMEEVYNHNLGSLEEELADANRQLTQ